MSVKASLFRGFLVASIAWIGVENPRPLARAASTETTSGFDQKLFGEMRWRNIGPHRAGRTKAIAGVVQQPYTFYAGVVNGGVWKTTDAGRTWKPIFDDQPTGSIGSVAVAPSDPNVVYVGSGEGLARPDLSVGDGVYRSADAGKTWVHLGLRDGQQIPNIAIDPKNPDRLFVAVAGHPYGPSTERGIFRSTDGGKTFEKVLYKDENIGGADVDIDPSNPDTVYATLWEERQGPWENAAWRGAGGGIFKSTDGGNTWKALKNGLPANVVQVNMTIAPSRTNRLFAILATPPADPAASRGEAPSEFPVIGIYRSEDGGDSWALASRDARGTARIGGGDLAVPVVNPRDPDMVVVASTVSYKSVDGGKTWVPFKGAPGGDDYQNAWINPNDPNIIALASDQGAVVTLNGGASWSSWYNQSTAQLYHVNADNAFPYRVCSGQQESGSACVASRGEDGQVTFREWHPVGVEEYGYAVPDPLNPDIIYGGKITRYDRRTSQVQNIAPVPGGRGGAPAAPGAPTYRTVRTLPVAFSPVDPHVLFFGNNYLWKTIDGGINWKKISDDPTRKTYELPTIGKYTDPALATQRGVIYSIAPSYTDVNRIWIGTDDGVVQTTADGGLTWKDVTPKQLGPWMKVFNMDAGHFDPLTAYAAVNTLRLDDMRPHLFRTHDGGKTWTEINTGMEDGGPTSSIREDPKRKGLLYAATERRVYVSFDDGDHWQSLQLNMASSSVRDIIVKEDDLIAATHGRGFWILDNVTPLRQLSADVTAASAHLFKPQAAYRVRWNTNTDTPLPPDEPGGLNPPEGAIIDYVLGAEAKGPVTLEIVDAAGKSVREYSSNDPVLKLDPGTINLPLYWFRAPMVLGTTPGMHRFTWDMHFQPLASGAGPRGLNLPIAAVAYNTVSAPTTPWVAPGTYTVKLTVNGQTYSQPLTVKQDPRVKTSAAVMQQVYRLSTGAYEGARAASRDARQAQAVRDQIAKIAATGPLKDDLATFDAKLKGLVGTPGRGGAAGPFGPAPTPPPSPDVPDSLADASAVRAAVMNSLSADTQPTALQLKAFADANTRADKVTARWVAAKAEMSVLNAKLKAANLPLLEIPKL